ncbi:hypothetical protein FS749_000815 [Ceratobasidium sp. UAMH 11750]|nr:hypothetical protein FS749_000815 [Ceratobasidium sp. UAMH 11750]
MLFFYPDIVLAKFLLLCVLTTHDAPTYISITAIDAGLRAAHYATYAALTQSGLQLPVGVFMPAPEAIGAGDVVVYVGPAAVATWRSSTGVLERISGFATILRAVVSRVADALHQQHQRLSQRLITHIPLILLPESTHMPGLLAYPWALNKSTTTPFSPVRLAQLVLGTGPIESSYEPISPTTGMPLTWLEASLIGSSVPRSDTCVLSTLGMCPASGAHPSETTWQRRPNLALLDELEGPTSLMVYEPPPPSDEFALSLDVRGQQYIIIHVRACLIGLIVACCAVFLVFYLVKFTLRLIFRLSRLVFDLVYTLSVSGCIMANHFLEGVLDILADIRGKLWRLVLEAHIRYAPRTKIPPVAPVVEADVPTLVKSLRKRSGKKKKKASKGELERLVLPACADYSTMDVGSRAVPPSLPPLVQPSATVVEDRRHPTSSTPSDSQTIIIGKPADDEGGEWTTVTRTRKNRKVSRPIPSGQAGSKSEGGMGRQ